MKGRTRRPFNDRCAKGATSKLMKRILMLVAVMLAACSSPRLPTANTAADRFAALHSNHDQWIAHDFYSLGQGDAVKSTIGPRGECRNQTLEIRRQSTRRFNGNTSLSRFRGTRMLMARSGSRVSKRLKWSSFTQWLRDHTEGGCIYANSEQVCICLPCVRVRF
jgi:hypothetical protein